MCGGPVATRPRNYGSKSYFPADRDRERFRRLGSPTDFLSSRRLRGRGFLCWDGFPSIAGEKTIGNAVFDQSPFVSGDRIKIIKRINLVKLSMPPTPAIDQVGLDFNVAEPNRAPSLRRKFRAPNSAGGPQIQFRIRHSRGIRSRRPNKLRPGINRIEK